ncbi:MAG: DPP IV N-terminal domain-containing protein [Gemmatimonadota bacterium]
MRIGSTIGCAALAALPVCSRAQQAAPNHRDAVYRAVLEFPSLVKGGVVVPQWMADSSSFWYADSMPDRTVIYRVDARKNERTPLFDTPRLRRSLASALGHEPPYAGLPFSAFTFANAERSVRFSLEGRDWLLDRDSYQITPAAAVTAAERERTTAQLVRRGFPTTGPDLFEVASPDRHWFATERSANLWVRSALDGRAEPLTRDTAKTLVWSVAGAKWAPNGLRIAAIRTNLTGVAVVPILHWLKPTEEVEWYPFTKVGGPMPRNEVYLIDVLRKEPVRVDLGSGADNYVSIVGWLPDGSELLVLRMSRDFKRLDLLAANPVSGATRLVLTESSDTFIKGIGANPGWANLVTPLEDGKRLVLISERDGWDHLYLYDLTGTLIKRLTSGTWPVLRVIATDVKGGWVYFTGHAESRLYDTHVYRVKLDGTGFARLTEGNGQHHAVFSPSKTYFVDTYSSIDRPPTTEVRSVEGKLVQTIARATIDSLKALGWKEPEEYIVKAADGTTDLYGNLYKPFDFDPARKYPVVEYIYGGPQTVNATKTFSQAWVAEQALAQLGFIVVVVDGRGTPERGRAFQDFVYKNFGRNEITDHVAALKGVAASRPYMDMSRVGIYGGSWGGYMTVRAMVTAPETYSVGIATFPVGDLYDHAASAIEPYMGLIANNRDGYEHGSSLRMAGNLKGKLLLIGGTNDVNATFSATIKLVDAFTRANRPYDLRVFAEQNHSLAGVNDYWRATVRDYFVKYLKPEAGSFSP